MVAAKDQIKEKQIILSRYTKALIQTLKLIKKKTIPAEIEKITVSQTASFLAIVYEKIRNAVEFREEHLVRRAAIERILKRRLALNPDGKGEAENLIRELLWARYLPNNSLTENDVAKIQKIIDNYLFLKKQVILGRDQKTRIRFSEYINDLLTCEIEEELNPELTQKKMANLYFLYQVLRNKVAIKEVSNQLKDNFFYVACEKAFSKNDPPYIRYHLFRLTCQNFLSLETDGVEKIAEKFPQIVEQIERTLNNPFNDKLTRFVKKQVPPFIILFTIIDRFPQQINEILTSESKLWQKVDLICREKYQEIGQKLKNAAIRSIIYIFLTKMIFVLALEYPLSLFFYNQVEINSLVINTLFPPFLMALIVSFVNIPGEKNTKNIFTRIIDILNKDPSFETTKNLITKKSRFKRPILIFGFTVFYLLTFAVTFILIYYFLDYLKFNLVSKSVFIFFLCVITFFGYRIRQTSKEYTLEEKESVFSPITDFFFVPILSVGSFLSREIAKLNIFILVFDFLIEAPFKLIVEVIEEWINFVKTRKEEIV
jgi:hypothetical protein